MQRAAQQHYGRRQQPEFHLEVGAHAWLLFGRRSTRKLLLHAYLLPINLVLVPGKLRGWLAGTGSLLHTGTQPCTGNEWSHHSVGMGWRWRWLQCPGCVKKVPHSNAGGELLRASALGVISTLPSFLVLFLPQTPLLLHGSVSAWLPPIPLPRGRGNFR